MSEAILRDPRRLTGEGMIFDIKRYAIHDGPGIRTTVFFKGCPLRCRWCHNPEGIFPARELWMRQGRCQGCGECVKVCPKGAISLSGGRALTDRGSCNCCGECVEACANGAREIVGRPAGIEEIMDEVEKDRVFYEESIGGVTLCGGEPLAQPEFARRLLEACRARGITTVLDTSCYAPWQTIEALRAFVDLFLCDIKHMDSEAHRRATGAGNELILENLRLLAGSGARMAIRFPLVPGINDQESNIQATGQFALTLGVREMQVLPYHEGGRMKRERFGEDRALAGIQPPSPGRLENVRASLAGLGLNAKIGG